MARRTTNRQNFTVPTNGYPEAQLFAQTTFKGLVDTKNDVTIDQMTLADVKNVYIDDTNLLKSRPPIKFDRRTTASLIKTNIIYEKQIGSYSICVTRHLFNDKGIINNVISYLETGNVDDITLRFTVSTSNIINASFFKDYPLRELDYDWDYEPKICCIPIKNKVFFWLDDTAKVLVNKTETGQFVWEDLGTHLYKPTHELVVNGITSTIEDKNFLTSSYVRRHLYSATSSVDFSDLKDKSFRFSLFNNNGERELYSFEQGIPGRGETVLYPQTVVNREFQQPTSDIIDIVYNPRATVTLLYDGESGVIDINLDNNYFVTLPHLDNIIGKPLLTRDGLCVVAFKDDEIYYCKIVDQEVDDFVSSAELRWERILSIPTYERTVAAGYFETIDNFCFISYDGKNITIGAHYQKGDGKIEICEKIIADTCSDAKICMRLLSPLDNNEMGPLIAGFYKNDAGSKIFCGSFINSDEGSFDFVSMIYTDALDDSDIMFSEVSQKKTENSVNVSFDLNVCYRNSRGYYRFVLAFSQTEVPTISFPSFTYFDINRTGQRYRFMPNTKNFITNTYYYHNDEIIDLPALDNLRPISILINGVLWYQRGAELWTNTLDDKNQMYIDEEIAGDVKYDIPEFVSELNEYYFVFQTDTKRLFEVTSARYDADGNFLLYLPTINEQEFTYRITNLHPLSQSEMGVFTEDGIWYIQSLNTEDGNVYYRQAVKSKIPVGCRYGDDIITAFDGQTLLFPTTRGIAAMAPQQFVATTEPVITYLSDFIQEKYFHFYNDKVVRASKRIRKSDYTGENPNIKICAYRYWILFYKYLSREILAFDTRTNTWWSWETQYPIRYIYVDTKLYFVLQVDQLPTKVDLAQDYNHVWAVPTYSGKRFVWEDRDEVSYNDAIDVNTLNGDVDVISEPFERCVAHYASSVIDWYIVSQNLHFGQIANYKAIKALMINAQGDETLRAELSTKVYRDFYHPEQANVIEVKINDLRTFVKHLNLMHVTNFQYRLGADKQMEVPHQLKLNSIGIKYEVKERIR